MRLDRASISAQRDVARRSAIWSARLYRFFYWLVLQRLPAEGTHKVSFALLRLLVAIPGIGALVRRMFASREPELRIRAFGRELPSPLGLAAGFDKDAMGVDALLALGFGFVEVGTVTAEAQPGNPKPRLFRLPARSRARESHGLQQRRRARGRATPRCAARSGAAPSASTSARRSAVEESEAIADYPRSAERLAPLADYLVVNVSSPNTPGLRNLQAVDKLRPLLAAVRDACDRCVAAARACRSS